MATSSSSSSSSSSSNNEERDAFIHSYLFDSRPGEEMFNPDTIAKIVKDEGTSESRPRKKRTEKPRKIIQYALSLQSDYFDVEPRYTDLEFRRRYRMSRRLFLSITKNLVEKTSFFKQKKDAAGRLGFSAVQKVTTALRLIAYDISADFLVEYLGMAPSTSMMCLKQFTRDIVSIYKDHYLREPNQEDVHYLNEINTRRGFPGMLGSIDCMHWKWKNCPAAWVGQYQSGNRKEPSIILQAVASQNLWIWHAYFGVSGCNNDINVLEHSDLFHNFSKGEAPACQYEIKGHNYNMGYYLADGIYPAWACFLKTIPNPIMQKHKRFAKYQEGARKDVERAFGVLQAR